MKNGSATLIIVLFSIVFMLYASSTYADVRHLKNKYNEYEQNIINQYEQEYTNKVNEL